jgi:hypothetical protein
MIKHAISLMNTLGKSTCTYYARRIESKKGRLTYIKTMKNLLHQLNTLDSHESISEILNEGIKTVNKTYPWSFLGSYETDRKYHIVAHQHVRDIYTSVNGRFLTGLSDTYSRKFKNKQSIHIYEDKDVFEE